MLFVRTSVSCCCWYSLFKQNRLATVTQQQYVRWSSNLPKKEDPAENYELMRPKERWDPVPQYFLKRLKVEHHGIGPASFNDATIWYPIFKFPYMTNVHRFVRFKLWVTVTSLGVTSYKLSHILLDNAPFDWQTAVGALSLVSMTIAGNFCRKLIVQIYVTEGAEYVRLSRFTFFGRRQDIVLPKSLLVPLTDTNDTHRKLLLKMYTKMPPVETIDLSYDNYEFYEDNYRIILGVGEIHNEESFEAIFGKLMRRIT